MQSVVPLACFLSIIRPPGVQYENALLQIAPVDKTKCPFVKHGGDIGFQLFTRHNPIVYQELALNDDERLFASNMDFSAPTVLYFHAFMEQPDDGSGVMLREAYMQRGDTNVIMVDASRLEAGPWYFTAAQNTWYIGRFAAAFVDYMVSRGLELNNTHFVGHSLGAQAAGVAGSALTSGRVSRITGLDPALPLFSGLPLAQRLDQSDAHFVDVIHTDAGIFGYKEPIGHADFFPNGGRSPQPGCELEVVLPQQLLLNKCDGTEQTRGFYSYYLTTNTELQDDSKEHSSLNQIKPVQTGSKRMNLDSTAETKEVNKKRVDGHTRLRMYLQKKSKIHIDVETHNPYEVRYFSPKIKTLRKKRVTRNAETVVAHTGQVSTTGEHLDIHTAINDTGTTEVRTPILDDTTLRNETTTQASNDVKQLTFKENQVKDDVKHIKPSDSRLHVTNQKTKHNHGEKTSTADTRTHTDRHAKKRQKRFLQFFSRSESDGEDNFIFRALNFLVKNRKSVLPIISVVRDINTLVKSGNGELNHVTRERNNYVGFAPPQLPPVTYSLELGNESRLMAFVKRLFGLSPTGDRLTIGSG